MTTKTETVLTKQGKSFTDYRHLTITDATQTCILNIIKGRLYSDRKTRNPTYEPYPTKQEALDRLNALAGEFKGQGFIEASRDVLFQFQKKELVVYDKAKWHYEGEFPREYLNIHNDIYTAVDFTEILAAGLPTIYHVDDTIENYRIIEPVISERHRDWKRRHHS
ncbi:hypothetical protein [Paenibacillus thiaminolyticus]|uniref:Uncharacterized protein n=1 Tax=Paenibacillus thiaminolyticus TaxID=49283 RepID=A0A3A3GSJ9_PANTH|nr:hypothetical protein [Paenibacillus thiaminolyticus]RJG26546.1 hypothetical protein DQX05_00410 [Paenibacillus thiaminolyticus]